MSHPLICTLAGCIDHCDLTPMEQRVVTVAEDNGRNGRDREKMLREAHYAASLHDVAWDRIEPHAQQAYDQAVLDAQREADAQIATWLQELAAK